MTSPYDSNSITFIKAGAQQVTASDRPKINGYDEFMSWRKSWNINSFGEEVFIEFFREAAETLAPESLSTLFFTLKSRIRSMHNVQIMEFASLIAFLAQKGLKVSKAKRGKPKNVAPKADIDFSTEEIHKFLKKAPDAEYLAIKAATVIGVYTDCVFADIRNITVSMVIDSGAEIVVRIPHKRLNFSAVYSISGEYCAIVRKYLKLRLMAQSKFKTEEFFVHYRDWKCVGGAMGRKTIGRMAEKIAQFLKLEHPANYTSNSFLTIKSKLAKKAFNTGAIEGNHSTFPACNETASKVSSSKVCVRNETTSIDHIRRSPDAENCGISDTNDAIDVGTDQKTSPVYTVDSTSEDDVVYENQSTSTKEKGQQQSDIQSVDPPSKLTHKVSHSNHIINGEIVSPTATHRMFAIKIESQAREIARLKQLTEKQSLEIEILKDLLETSMKRSVRDAMSSENAVSSRQ